MSRPTPSTPVAADAAEPRADATPSASGTTLALPESTSLDRLAPDGPPSIPGGGLVLLALLALVAIGAWWQRARGRRLPLSGRFPLYGPDRRRSDTTPVEVEPARWLEGRTRLYVVRWHGRELLVAAGGVTAPVVLDRLGAAGTEPGSLEAGHGAST